MDFGLLPRHSVTGSSIFSVMSALAQEHGAINLSQGFPDFPLEPGLAALLEQAVKAGHNQYAPSPGLPLLLQQISGDLSRRYGVQTDAAKEITVTPGASYGIYTAFAAMLRKGDEVIVLEPAYDCYIPAIEMNGGIPVTVPLRAPLFDVDWNAVKAAITPKTRAIIVNTPHNPTGAVWTAEDVEALAALTRNTGIMVISDEVYEQIVFDGRKHLSLLQHEELRQRSFVIFSFGKVYHNTGWKIGYTVAPPAFTAAFRSIHQYIAFSVNTPAQFALAQFLDDAGREPVSQMMERKRNYFLELMRDSGFEIFEPSAGSYFQIAGYARISALPDREFAAWLTREHGVATVPVSAFYRSGKDDRLVRFCFAKKEETLKAAADRLLSLK